MPLRNTCADKTTKINTHLKGIKFELIKQPTNLNANIPTSKNPTCSQKVNGYMKKVNGYQKN